VSTPPQIFFFFLSGSKKGKIESSDAQVTRIGRQPYCEIKLDPQQDIPASGDHCHVIREADGYYLLDSGSTFGTFLNGQQVQGRSKLSTGDVIDLGKDAAQGREGPRLKFYLETDVRKCPCCSGPVYKRHFRCPSCNKKTCLRCIDFAKKICLTCATAPAAKASAGFDVVDDDVEAKRPAKVIISGKDAARVKEATKKNAERSAAAAAEKVAEKSEAPTQEAPAKSPSSLDLDVPFCLICQDIMDGEAFLCPACDRRVCASHRQGKVCQPCAGVKPAAPSDSGSGKKTRIAERVQLPSPLVPPSADDVEDSVQLAELPPTTFAKRKAAASPPPKPVPVPRTTDGEDAPPPTMRFRAPPPPPGAAPAPLARTSDGEEATPPTMRFRPPPPPGAPGSVPPAALPPSRSAGAPPRSAPPPVRTGIASCARCHGPLGAGTFCCRACRRILCFAHVAVDDCCEDCYLAGRDRSTAPRAGVPSTQAPQPRPGPFGGPGQIQERPPGYKTAALPATDLGAPLPPPFDPDRGATIAEIEALDMMPLLDTEKDEDAALDDDLARPPPGSSEIEPGDLRGLSFVCPHCDAPLDAAARACPRCRKVL
jgi:hypothetical protein